MPEKKNKHLTITDRIEIEKSIAQGKSFANIAKMIGVATSTASRKVKQNRPITAKDKKSFNLSVHKSTYTLTNICGSCTDGIGRCKGCRKVKCFCVCKSFEERKCHLLKKAPFICGGCPRYVNCRFRHASYHAVDAQIKHECRLVESREGISLSASELVRVVFDYTPIGKDGFVFLVNADNPIDSLTIDQVKDIYAGRITNEFYAVTCADDESAELHDLLTWIQGLKVRNWSRSQVTHR